MSHPPRILLCGKGDIACRALGYLADYLAVAGLDSRLLVHPTQSDSGNDTWEPSLCAEAGRRGIPCLPTIAAAQLAPDDVLFSLQYDRIIGPAETGGARSFNLHFSALPAYRGCYPAVWPLRRGERQAGVTLHVLTAGIDDGDIIGQRLFPVAEWITAWGLYGLLQDNSYALFKQQLPLILEQREIRQPQDHAAASYFNRHSIDFRAREIDVRSMSASEAANWIRSLIFDPRQFPTFQERPIAACEVVEGLQTLPGEPGDVLLSAHGHGIVRCRDGALRLRWKDVVEHAAK